MTPTRAVANWLRRAAAAGALALLGACGPQEVPVVHLSAPVPATALAVANPAAAGPAAASVAPAPAAPAGRPLTLDAVLDAQPVLLGQALDALAPQRPGITDLYFVGFAGDGRQDVFLNEAEAVKAEIDRLYDAAGRSLVLANAAASVGSLPLATPATLDATLHAVASRMDPDEDVLFLFLTSHANHDGSVTIAFPGLDFHPLTPQALADMLDAAGIRYRVVVVSACFSGAFVDRLRNADTLVASAARRDRASFGCQSGRQFTYFGEAYFGQALPADPHLADAFDTARRLIAAREQEEGLPASEPQIAVGAAIRPKLAEIEQRVAAGGA